MTKTKEVQQYLANERFSRSFTLPADLACRRDKALNVTYSDLGYQNGSDGDGDGAVVVFIGGLMGGRWTLFRADDMARRLKVRIITVDRPGMGRSDTVPLEHRMETWLATFPALLAHLKVQHVALACHSAGAIYTLNTLLQHRKLLHLRRPYVAFFAPWVHPKDSGVMAMRIIAALPSSAVGSFPSLARFVQAYIAPTVGFSSGLKDILPSKAEAQTVNVEDVEEAGKDGKDWSQDDALVSEVTKMLMKEDISGGGHEALLVVRGRIKKSNGGNKEVVPWGGKLWTEYDECVQLLVEQEEELRRNGQSSSNPLKIHTYHAASDPVMVGSKGVDFFDACWKGSKVAKVISYSSSFAPGTDHDTIVDPKMGAVEDWLKQVAHTFRDSI